MFPKAALEPLPSEALVPISWNRLTDGIVPIWTALEPFPSAALELIPGTAFEPFPGTALAPFFLMAANAAQPELIPLPALEPFPDGGGERE